MSEKCQSLPYAPQQSVVLFDHFIGDGKKPGRNRQPKRLCGLEVDHELESCRLHDWQVARLLALQVAINIASGAPGLVEEIGAVGDETASDGKKSARCRSRATDAQPPAR